MIKAKIEDLKKLYKHLSIQSILDIKDNFNEVSFGVLEAINKDCESSYLIYNNNKVMAGIFIFNTINTYNIIIYTGSLFIKNKEVCCEKIKELLNMLKGKEINSIIYKNARQILEFMYYIGFIPKQNKNYYKILEYIK
jgi:hypothetical protein